MNTKTIISLSIRILLSLLFFSIFYFLIGITKETLLSLVLGFIIGITQLKIKYEKEKQ